MNNERTTQAVFGGWFNPFAKRSTTALRIPSKRAPDTENKYPGGIKQFIPEIVTSEDVKGTGKAQYGSTHTDTLAWIIEEVSGEKFGDLFQDRIYKHLGAQHDAFITTDRHGVDSSSGGLIMTLQDLARYGQVWANQGVAPDGTQVIPQEWIDELRTDTKGTEYSIPSYRYHNQITSNGNTLAHLGYGNQIMFVDPETKVVMIHFGSSTDWTGATPKAGLGFYDLGEKISKYLSE